MSKKPDFLHKFNKIQWSAIAAIITAIATLSSVFISTNSDIFNQKPIARAGQTQEVFEGDLVHLSGASSEDRDGKIESYRWKHIFDNDTDIVLSDRYSANPTFRAPNIPIYKELFFVLEVTDDRGESSKDTVRIKVNPHYNVVGSWGISGKNVGQFNSPQGIAVDPLFNNVYVVDKLNSRIQAFDADGHSLVPAEWGSKGNKSGQFNLPENIAIDLNGEFIYIADSNNSRIQKFYPWGIFISEWGSYCALHDNNYGCKIDNSTGIIGPGQFRYPQGIAIDIEGHVYVADFSNDRIQKFDSNGNFIKTWGSRCNMKWINNSIGECKDLDGNGPMEKGDGQFLRPKGIAINHITNEVYIVDKSNDRIQKFDSNGNFKLKWGSAGKDDGQFNLPEYIAINPKNNYVYVGDENNNRIQVFDQNGNFIENWGSSGDKLGKFQNPEGIGVDIRTGDILVVEENNHRVQKFKNFIN